MTFTPDAKVYVSYSTGIMQPVVELLTISKYKNNLLYFKEKASYYAVECYNAASFYGFSNTMAGKIFVTKHKWQLPFAKITEKMKFVIPVNQVKAVKQPALKLRLSKLS